MPGAAGLNAMNHLYEVAPRDGTVIAVLTQDIAFQAGLGTKGVRYDATRFNYIGRATANVPVHMVWHTAPVRSIDDLKRREVVTGAVGTGGTQVDLPRAQNALIGTKWKVIAGYRAAMKYASPWSAGKSRRRLRLQRCSTSQFKPWLEQGTVRVVVQYADFRHPIVSRRSDGRGAG